MSEKEALKIETRVLDEKSRISMVSINGFVDQANSHLLQQAIDSCLAEKSFNLVFNLQNLAYMSSAGWGVIIGEIKRFRENNGDIKLANMGPEIYEIYQMLEFYHIINEYGSVEDAMKAFGTKLESIENAVKNTTRKTFKEKKKPPVEDPPADSTKGDGVEQAPVDSTAENVNEADVISEEEIDLNIDGILASEGIVKAGGDSDLSGYIEFDVSKFNREVDLKVRPIPDKIRDIISKHPDFGLFKIKKILKTGGYGGIKISFWKLRSLLKALELDTKEKRYRFFRSA